MLDDIVDLSCYLATDWQFAFTREGKRVPFATAGDCYSAAHCPQVRTTTAVKLYDLLYTCHSKKSTVVNQ